jgi:polysaccharide export outer membrane protein
MGTSAYRIGPFDVLEIQVFKVPELSKTVQVSEAGTINYPLIGEVAAAGRSARQVEQSLTQALGADYLRDPQVSVYVREYNSQRVTVEGAITKPGVYPIRGDMSLLQLLAISGGVSAISDDTIVIFRTVDTRRTVARFDVEPIRKGTAPDPKLAAGDMVIVGKSSLKEGFSNVMKALPIAGVFTML